MLKPKTVDTPSDLSTGTTNIKKYSHSLNTGPNNPAYQFYRLIRPELQEWWHEFSTEWDPIKECWRYRTAHQFAKAKTQDRREREWIEGMIGPVPLTFGKSGERRGKAVYLKLPWLGDWEARRTPPEPPAQIRALAQAVKEKLVAWDAIRSAAPYLVREMARYEKMSEQIEEAFAGQPFDMSKPLHDNRLRFNMYFEMMKKVTDVKRSLLHDWMLVHGINPKDPVQLTQNNMMIGQLGQAEQPSVRDMEAIKLARMLQMHSENFKMPLPKFKSEQVAEAEPEKTSVKTTNGKVM